MKKPHHVTKAIVPGTKARKKKDLGKIFSGLIKISGKDAEEIKFMEEGAVYKDEAMRKRCNM